MNAPQVLFGLVGLVGCIWFVWRRKVDPVAIGFASSIIYFVPGLFGWVGFPSGDGVHTYSEPIGAGAYLVMATVLATPIFASLISPPMGKPICAPNSLRFLPQTFLTITWAAAAVSIAGVGAFYLCQKTEMLPHIGGWHYLAAYTLPFCIVVATVEKRYAILALSIPLLLADLYIGFRVNLAIVLLAILMLRGNDLRMGWWPAARLVGAVLGGGAVLILFPQVAYTLKYIVGSYCPATPELASATASSGGSAQLANLGDHLTTAAPYLDSLFNSEPFVIQSVLNTVINSGFRTGYTYLLDQLSTGIPGGASLFGLDGAAPSFNSLFQPHLFPNVPYGMANSPWAQAYAAGGFAMVWIFSIAYGAILWALSRGFYKTEGSLKALVAVVATWFAFYFHRNDLLAQVGIMKQVVYTSVAACVIAIGLWAISRAWAKRSITA